MAGSASRIYHFCHSFPNSSGCPFPPLVNQPQPKACDDFPFEIGTANSCRVYNIYWMKDEYSESEAAIAQWTNSTSATTTGTTYNLVAPLYSGIYSSSDSPANRNKIGYVRLITTQVQYDTDETILNTDNYSFFWINAGQIVASMDTIYDYVGTDTNTPFFQPYSTHYLNSTATNAHQLLDKRLAIKLYVGDPERQCKLTFKV